MKPNSAKIRNVSLVMPVYNEAEVIEDVIKKYSAVLRKIPYSEFVICEDGSTDGTKKILKRLQKKYRLTLYLSPERKGAVGGFLNALYRARKNIIWFSDSDNTHNPEDVFSLLKNMRTSDMVIGRKFPRKDPFYRIFTSWGLNVLINNLFGTHFHDINSGFRIIQKNLLDDLLPNIGTFPGCTLTELTLLAIKKGYNVKEVPVTHYERHGQSRAIDLKKIPEMSWNIMKEIVRLRLE